MYEVIKSWAKWWLPTSWLEKRQKLIRSLIARWYRGKGFECNICRYQLSRFIRLKNGESLCPNCGSLPRARRLWSLLQSRLTTGSPMAILDFSPSPCLVGRLRTIPGLVYITTDYSGEFEADFHFDITALDIPDNSFDLIVCYHVLEHVQEDIQAMKELYRVLKPGGTSFLQTPFKEGDIHEDPVIVDPLEREKHFGQQDHVRIYSVEGLKKRLESAGFQAQSLEFTDSPVNRWGLKEKEWILVAQK